MAKKAKRRGRPPGSKNKKSAGKSGNGVGKIGKSFANMEVGQLRALINDLEGLLAKRVQQQKEILEGHLAELQGYVSARAAGVVRTVMRVPRSGKRAKAQPKYQSKKNPVMKWSGRGMTPIWMREEMKGTKLKKDDFLIR
jgi:DNA-binding protein H-NS